MNKAQSKQGVVLLHGILRTKYSMRGLAKHLSARGFTVLNLGYPSRRFTIPDLVEFIQSKISQFILTEQIDKIHFVGFSMGGLLIRALLNKYRPANLGRVVFLATPHKGSEIGDWLKANPLYRLVFGPAGQQLGTEQGDFLQVIGTVDYPAAAIAGDRTIDPICSRIIKKPNDGKVSIESALLKEAQAIAVIPSSHNFFPSNREMWGLVAEFLEEGTLKGSRRS